MLKVVPEVVEARTELARPGSDAVDVLVAVGGGGKEHEVGGIGHVVSTAGATIQMTSLLHQNFAREEFQQL